MIKASIILHSSSLFLALILVCLLLDIILALRQLNRREPLREFWSKIIGSNFFLLYIGYRAAVQFDHYSRFPELFSAFSWLNWSLIILLYAFFVAAFIGRTAPMAAASGWKEIFLPFFCATLPFALFETIPLAHFPWIVNHPILFRLLNPLHPLSPGSWNPVSLSLLLIGNSISVLGLFSLRNSFSITTEARALVQRGLYRFVRHPVYLGESLALIGSCLIVPSWCNVSLTVLWLACQRWRASLEERKLVDVFPEYAEYRRRTGVYFPKILLSPSRS